MVRCQLFVLLLLSSNAFSQIRLGKLILEKRQNFIIEKTDILVVDTLIMNDSSSIQLNSLKKDNFIHAKEVFIGEGCFIFGNGKNGVEGKSGASSLAQSAPCRNGAIGKDAEIGGVGTDGNNLSVYFNNLTIKGSIIINLNGGDGGNGGKGGRGGDGGSGTRVCAAGNGGNGGNGAKGGNGGNGGTFSISCKNCEDLHLILGNNLIVKNFGGFGGLPGEGGQGGLAGLGPVRDGRNGQRGIDGVNSSQGKTGVVNVSRN